MVGVILHKFSGGAILIDEIGTTYDQKSNFLAPIKPEKALTKPSMGQTE